MGVCVPVCAHVLTTTTRLRNKKWETLTLGRLWLFVAVFPGFADFTSPRPWVCLLYTQVPFPSATFISQLFEGIC